IFPSSSPARRSAFSTSKIAPKFRQDLASVLEPLSRADQVHRMLPPRMILALSSFRSKPLDLSPHLIGAPEQRRARAAILDDPGAARAAPRREPLPLDPEARLGFRKTSDRLEPRDPRVRGRLDQDDAVQRFGQIPGAQERR